jgi:hypothetical protein
LSLSSSLPEIDRICVQGLREGDVCEVLGGRGG